MKESASQFYIPVGVKSENEIFTGFGKKELRNSAIGSLIGGLVSFVVWSFKKDVATTVVIILVGIFGSVMMTVRDQSNQSVVDQVSNLINFSRSQKIYPYRYIDEWDIGKWLK